jgi:hypothetical protein
VLLKRRTDVSQVATQTPHRWPDAACSVCVAVAVRSASTFHCSDSIPFQYTLLHTSVIPLDRFRAWKYAESGHGRAGKTSSGTQALTFHHTRAGIDCSCASLGSTTAVTAEQERGAKASHVSTRPVSLAARCRRSGRYQYWRLERWSMPWPFPPSPNTELGLLTYSPVTITCRHQACMQPGEQLRPFLSGLQNGAAEAANEGFRHLATHAHTCRLASCIYSQS